MVLSRWEWQLVNKSLNQKVWRSDASHETLLFFSSHLHHCSWKFSHLHRLKYNHMNNSWRAPLVNYYMLSSSEHRGLEDVRTSLSSSQLNFARVINEGINLKNRTLYTSLFSELTSCMRKVIRHANSKHLHCCCCCCPLAVEFITCRYLVDQNMNIFHKTPKWRVGSVALLKASRSPVALCSSRSWKSS